MSPYRTPPPSPVRRVPWHVRAVATALRVAWRAGSPFDPWQSQAVRRNAGGEWEQRAHVVVPGAPTWWSPASVSTSLTYVVVAREVWP